MRCANLRSRNIDGGLRSQLKYLCLDHVNVRVRSYVYRHHLVQIIPSTSPPMDELFGSTRIPRMTAPRVHGRSSATAWRVDDTFKYHEDFLWGDGGNRTVGLRLAKRDRRENVQS